MKAKNGYSQLFDQRTAHINSRQSKIKRNEINGQREDDNDVDDDDNNISNEDDDETVADINAKQHFDT